MNDSGIDTHAIDADAAKSTIEAYNETAEHPIVNGPFHCAPMSPAIFCNFGGLAINDKAQVLDAAHQPIAGVYAAFPTAGGIMAGAHYCGAIAHAGVTGRWAADSAAEALGLK